MNFENIGIYPPDNYRFLNVVPNVIDLYTLLVIKMEYFFKDPILKRIAFSLAHLSL